MSLLEKIDPPEAGEIERQEADPVRGGQSASLGEQLSSMLHRLSWRTPFHALRLRGRHALKLLAVPKDPVAGDKAAGEAILKGRFVRRGESFEIEGLDPGDPALPEDLSDYLHSFEWLRDLAAAATRERAAKLAENSPKVAGRTCRGVTEPACAPICGAADPLLTAYAPYICRAATPPIAQSPQHAVSRRPHLDKTAERPGRASPGSGLRAWPPPL